MKKGQMCEGIVEKIKFPNKGIVKVEDSEVTVKNTGREAAEMTVCLPALYEKKYSDTRNVLMITAVSYTHLRAHET